MCAVLLYWKRLFTAGSLLGCIITDISAGNLRRKHKLEWLHVVCSSGFGRSIAPLKVLSSKTKQKWRKTAFSWLSNESSRFEKLIFEKKVFYSLSDEKKLINFKDI